VAGDIPAVHMIFSRRLFDPGSKRQTILIPMRSERRKVTTRRAQCELGYVAKGPDEWEKCWGP